MLASPIKQSFANFPSCSYFLRSQADYAKEDYDNFWTSEKKRRVSVLSYPFLQKFFFRKSKPLQHYIRSG